MYENESISNEMGLNREYQFKCRVKEKRIQAKRGKDDSKTFESFHVILVPLESTQRDLFYSAWLPSDEYDPETTDQEVLITIAHPHNLRKVRASLARPNSLYPHDIHMVVMDEIASDHLRDHALGKKISVMVHSQNDELRDVGIELD